MKQHISKLQAVELLRLDGRSKMIKFINGRDDILMTTLEVKDENGCGLRRLPLLNIGQLIEFLGEDNSSEMLFTPYGRVCITHDWYESCNNCQIDKNHELIDALWEAIKLLLNKK